MNIGNHIDRILKIAKNKTNSLVISSVDADCPGLVSCLVTWGLDPDYGFCLSGVFLVLFYFLVLFR